MPTYKNVAFSEGMWRRLKQRALDEGVTLREVAERACHAYLHAQALQASAPAARTIPRNPEKHWTPDE